MKRAALHLLFVGASMVALYACAPLLPPQPIEPPPPMVVTPPPPPKPEPQPAPVRPAPPPVRRYQDRERRALQLVRRDQLRQALTEWKILEALDPDNAEYRRQVSATRALIWHRSEKHIAAGDAALADGNEEQAQLEYLKALALDPWQREPLAKLRQIERERVLTVQGERLAKLEARRSGGRKGSGGKPNGGSPSQQEKDYLETGIALFKQGEYEESILEIQKYLQSFPDDAEARRYVEEAHRRIAAPAAPVQSPPPLPSAKPAAVSPPPPPPPTEATEKPQKEDGPTQEDRNLAKDFYDKGLRASRTNIAQAIEYWEQALRYDPGHVQAKLQLEQAWRMLKNLKEIPKE